LKKILISAGEASGDFYGAELAKEIKKQRKGIAVIGFGGPRMRSAGVDVRIDRVKHAVMGFWEAARTINVHLSQYFQAMRVIKREKPDVLVVIDSPAFHLPLIKDAKSAGVKKIIYYSTPQVWVWKYNRIYTIKKYADLAIVVLPFEEDIFRKEGIRVKYFGHPVAPYLPGAVKAAGTGGSIGIFPGSRDNEIKYFFEDILKACELIKQKRKNSKFLLFKADSISDELIGGYLRRHPGLHVRTVKGWDLKSRAQLPAAIAKSGTVTLELALLGVPHAIVYRVSAATYFIMRLMAKGRFVGLPNIILGKETVKEFIQGGLKPDRVSAEILRLLSDRKYAAQMRSAFRRLRQKHGNEKYVVRDVAGAVLAEAGI
jgi:lipid-A-disaccharide synthase